MDGRFRDRREAGDSLASALGAYAGRADVVVLALPRGGIPVGAEVARVLRCPLDVLVVRKLGVPSQRELAMGAIASGGITYINERVVRAARLDEQTVARVAAAEQEELERREATYRGDRERTPVDGRIVIVVDDGLATGATMKAAVSALRTANPARIVVAVPVGPADTCRDLEQMADELVCLAMPERFLSVGYWYDDFGQVSDDEVRAALARAAADNQAGSGGDAS